MRTVRIYQPGKFHLQQMVELSPAASRHVSAVLRMQPGQSIQLFCGDNQEYTAVIRQSDKKKVLVEIQSIAKVGLESPRPIHLAQAISKGERMEIVMQKAVELGVASITPILSARSVVRLDKERLHKKQSQWQAIVIAACEQSGRNVIPKVHAPCSFETYLHQCSAVLKLILYPGAHQSWRDYDYSSGDIALLIGPEGGLNDEEIALALQYQFQPLSLGPRILRTETAAIAALAVLQAVSGDL